MVQILHISYKHKILFCLSHIMAIVHLILGLWRMHLYEKLRIYFVLERYSVLERMFKMKLSFITVQIVDITQYTCIWIMIVGVFAIWNNMISFILLKDITV